MVGGKANRRVENHLRNAFQVPLLRRLLIMESCAVARGLAVDGLDGRDASLRAFNCRNIHRDLGIKVYTEDADSQGNWSSN